MRAARGRNVFYLAASAAASAAASTASIPSSRPATTVDFGEEK
jgi:hypothetical protein